MLELRCQLLVEFECLKVETTNLDYSFLERNPASGKQWRDIGGARRLGGVAAPAFSLYSRNSISIADYSDLKLAIDFCYETKSRILQLLPMNWAGFANAPYMAESGFALDAVYLSLNNMKGLHKSFQKEIDDLKRKPEFQIFIGNDGASRVNYEIKKEKLALAFKMFKSRDWEEWVHNDDFQKFMAKASYWLDGYVIYRVFKELNQERSWLDWNNKFKDGDLALLNQYVEATERLAFHKWLQWQLFEQAKELKDYATKQGVLIMGDIPFLPARDSADVWTDYLKKTNYFNLDLQAGALPDMYFADGQLWGNPVPNWEEMAKGDYKYIRQKRRYASNFYHIERKDHEIGQFRLYINPINTATGRKGWFLPDGKIGNEESERKWQSHGKKLVSTQIQDLGSTMLYTSEGLGSPPRYMRETLDELGVPDIHVQRWTKEGERFTDPRLLGISTTGTHDCSMLPMWWEKEVGTIDRQMFNNLCEEAGIRGKDRRKLERKLFSKTSSETRLRWKEGLTGNEGELQALSSLLNEFKNTHNEEREFLNWVYANNTNDQLASPHLVRLALEKLAFSPSIFNVPCIFDLESTNEEGLELAKNHRINLPGKCDGNLYWNLRTARSLENMISDDKYINYVRNLNISAKRD